MRDSATSPRTPWAWVPTLYTAEGLPYVLVMTVSLVMYKTLGVSNADIALYTSWLYLPWVIKPLWSPLVDVLGTRRWWIWAMQLVLGGGLAGVALTIPTSAFFQYTLAFLFLVAFSSATHDIAADGLYLLALGEAQQAFFVGIRGTFYRVATIIGQGLVVILAGLVQRRTRSAAGAWSLAFGATAALMLALGAYHRFVLPRVAADAPLGIASIPQLAGEWGRTFTSFFQKDRLAALLGFLLLYRFAEAQLGRVAPLFMLEARDGGGLGLATDTVGFLYGTVGVAALLAGGVLGGVAASRRGFRFWVWPMALAINLPDIVFVYLAYALPDSAAVVGGCVAVEQFGYGFGFTAYMLYMMHIARGPHSTAHFALCTGFMALGMMLPGMWSGMLQEALGYRLFFLWVMLATIPSYLAVWLMPLDREFGTQATPRAAEAPRVALSSR
jgi:PAT family beta-lactamase induction signal transducer AmpG